MFSCIILVLPIHCLHTYVILKRLVHYRVQRSKVRGQISDLSDIHISYRLSCPWCLVARQRRSPLSLRHSPRENTWCTTPSSPQTALKWFPGGYSYKQYGWGVWWWVMAGEDIDLIPQPLFLSSCSQGYPATNQFTPQSKKKVSKNSLKAYHSGQLLHIMLHEDVHGVPPVSCGHQYNTKYNSYTAAIVNHYQLTQTTLSISWCQLAYHYTTQADKNKKLKLKIL